MNGNCEVVIEVEHDVARYLESGNLVIYWPEAGLVGHLSISSKSPAPNLIEKAVLDETLFGKSDSATIAKSDTLKQWWGIDKLEQGTKAKD